MLMVCAGLHSSDAPLAQAANRLAKESSPYLLQHAHNPVDWYPWGAEAFAKAKREGRLVFLSIGYSSCHWCHVMERESFENPEVAKLLNDWFVSIKVDREERPDIDSIYMTALNVTGERGGWPLSMFLTADGKPIGGGTYWPADDRERDGEKIRGFKTILRTVHQWAGEKPAEVRDQADRLAAETKLVLARAVPGKALVDLNRALVDGVVDALKDEFDPQFGGFGNPSRHFRGPKFPVPSYGELLLQEVARTHAKELSDILDSTLDHMARGGIYDQLGGGFHRYSTERTWTVPHFEKMLYDNAQLVELYAHAYRQAPKPEYQRVIRQTLRLIEGEMTAPEGGFYSALDADSSGGEGSFYVWTPAEIQAVLGSDAAYFQKLYGIEGRPNFESKAYILTLPRALDDAARETAQTEALLEQRLAPLRQKLLAVRSERPRPFCDTKILTAWNGQMIAGYAAAGQALGEPSFIAAASRAAEFVLKYLRAPDGRLLHVYAKPAGRDGQARLDGYLDDYAFLVHGLLNLYDATHDRRWIAEARTLTDTMIEQFADRDAGGFFFTANNHEKPFARAKDQYDSAQPSGNSIAADNLVRLWRVTQGAQYRDVAERTLKAFAPSLKTNPTSLTAMAVALERYLETPVHTSAKPPSLGEALVQAGGGKTSDSVVKVSAKATPARPGQDGKQVVSVTFAIDSGWHLYANPPGLDDLVPVQTTIEVSAGVKPEDVKIEYPEGKLITDPILGKYRVFEDSVTLKATVRRAAGDTSPLEITAKFQACNDKQCLLPASKTIKLAGN
jgi:uncharacterized protein YyaL (SSP411 family)